MFHAIALLAAVAVAQPPTPDAVLVAGRIRPASDLAVETALVPVAVAVGAAGRLYVAEYTRVWQVDGTGRITPVAAPPGGYQNINSLAVDSDGVLYVADHIRVWRVAGAVAPTVFYQGLQQGTQSLAVDGGRNLYISDGPRARVWKVTPEGAVSPYAGTGTSRAPRQDEGAIPVPALQYDLYWPGRIAFDGAGNLYLADDFRLHKIARDGTLTRLQDFGSLRALAADATGRLYTSGFLVVTSLDARGGIVHVAGGNDSPDGCTPDRPGFRDARKSILLDPRDLAVDSQGNLYIADPGLSKVRKVAPDFSISTVAGAASNGRFGGDGGTAVSADLAAPSDLALDRDGSLFITDSGNHRIRRVDRQGYIETVAGAGPVAGEDPACFAPNADRLLWPGGVAVDAAGIVYISDTGHHRVLARSPEGKLTVAAQLNTPLSLALDPAGNVLVGQPFRVSRIQPDGTLETVATTDSATGAIAADTAGNVYFALVQGVTKLTPSGHFIIGPGPEPSTLAADSGGTVYSGGSWLSAVAKDCIHSSIVSSSFTVLNPFPFKISGLAVSPEGDIFASDARANLVWRIPARRLQGVPAPQLDRLPLLNGATRTPRTVFQLGNCGTVAFPVPCQRPVAAAEEPAPGELVLVKGVCLGAMERTAAPSGIYGPLPNELGGTRVWFDEVAAPVLWSQSDEVAVIAPYEIAGRKDVRLKVEYLGAAASAQINTSAASPGWVRSGDGYIVARNEDGSLNSKARPAPRGTVVTAWATGEGQTDPPGVTGRRAFEPLPRPILPVGVKVGEAAAEILYAGAAPGTAGILQVNFRIPKGLKLGATQLVLTVGTASASASIWVD